MSHTAEIEFVCYAEGGFINLQRALEDFLPQTLVELPPDDESFGTAGEPGSQEIKPFQPAVRPLELHIAHEDLLAATLQRFPIFQRAADDAPVHSYEALFPPTHERVYPFKRPEGAGAASTDQLPQLVERAPRVLPRVEKEPSFHDFLAARSLERATTRRRGPVAKPKAWQNGLTWFVGEIIMCAGAGALIAGLLALKRGESIAGGTGLVIASGIVAISSILLTRRITKLGTRNFATPARA